MTSSNGNIFRVTGLLWGEFNGHRWIPLTKVNHAELSCFLDLRLNKRSSKQSRGESDHMLRKVLDEITYPFPYLNDETAEA